MKEGDQENVNNNHHEGGGGAGGFDETDPSAATVVSREIPLQGAYLEGAFQEPNLRTGQYSFLTYFVVTSPPEYAAVAAQTPTGQCTLTAAMTDDYRGYYVQPAADQYVQAVRQHCAEDAAAASGPQGTSATSDNGTTITSDTDKYVERYITEATAKAQNTIGTAVELPFPDSGGIGDEAAAAVTLRDAATLHQYYAQPATEQYAQAVRQHLAAAAAAASANSFPQVTSVTSANGTTITGDTDNYVVRYVTAAGYRKGTAVVTAATANAKNTAGIAVELPSPDSGIGGEAAAAVTLRDAATLHQISDCTEPQTLPTEQDGTIAAPPSASTSPFPGTVTAGSATGFLKASKRGSRIRRSGSKFFRTPEADKVHIPKVFSDVGFKYYLETPISTSRRRDNDRMTYITKGQYYGLTLEYIPDPERPLRSGTVKSLVMLVFREKKSAEDESKAWKCWYSRQRSLKQRILDANINNDSGVIGQIKEVSLNAIEFYWNPLDRPAKLSISVHCMSTEFSNQKGVKGLPLHLQIDTTDDLRENCDRVHRAYCQIKVFCDLAAKRQIRIEKRRAAKQKFTSSYIRKKLDEMYHLPCHRSEFYSMSDLTKPPVLFMPQDDHENCNRPGLRFYATEAVPMDGQKIPTPGKDVKAALEVPVPPLVIPAKKIKVAPPGRVLLYIKGVEDIYHPLHVVPPTLEGLAKALVDKYGISDNIRHLYKKCKKGVTVEMDDDMVRHYCHEDTFIVEIISTENGQLDVAFVEL